MTSTIGTRPTNAGATGSVAPVLARPHQCPGYTLIEMLVVMGIVLAMSTLALMSVTSMLRGTRMSRGVSLMVASADESRSSAFTLRRSTRIDLTRINFGKERGRSKSSDRSRSIFERRFRGLLDRGTPGDPDFPDASLQAAWLSNSGAARQVVADTSRALLAHGGVGGSPFFYWNPGYRGTALSGDDFEVVVEARIKIMAAGDRTLERQVGILGCVSDSGGGGGMSAGYSLTATIDPSTAPGNTARNNTSTVSLNKIGGMLSGTPAWSSMRWALHRRPAV